MCIATLLCDNVYMSEFDIDVATLSPQQAQERLIELEGVLSRLNGHRVLLIMRALGQGLPAKQNPDELISLEDAAKRINVSKAYLYRNRQLPFLRKINGRKTMVSKLALDRWCETRRPK